ncbi:hypothetical protein BZM27_10510 [Paraburkholderia steynii]|uniref:Uncharacterized protein n=1 Tax=Paraburkholderia steynii TaxID=1245441 RepID=A0A4R0XKQ8_9BURK|nr:hypothetical protein BZM27_10510 [Paraburkholderia steynii]
MLFEGIDKTNSRYGEVTLSRCQHCSTAWLRFFIEYESFSHSGRWYRAPVPCEREIEVTAERAIEMLNSLEPRFAGGSYFNSEGFETRARVDLQP